jgi:hypothetical protein
MIKPWNDLFWNRNRIRDKRRGQIIIRTGTVGRRREGETPRHSMINDKCLEAVLLLLGEDALVKTGEKALNPGGESNFLDPEQVLGLMESAADGEFGTVGVDLILVARVGSAVGEEEMTSSEHSIGRKVVDHISQHLAPNGVGLIEDFRDFLGREHKLIKLLPGFVASKSSEELPSMGQVSGSFPLFIVEVNACWMV